MQNLCRGLKKKGLGNTFKVATVGLEKLLNSINCGDGLVPNTDPDIKSFADDLSRSQNDVF